VKSGLARKNENLKAADIATILSAVGWKLCSRRIRRQEHGLKGFGEAFNNPSARSACGFAGLSSPG
jgi:hypothetical protein